MKTIWNSAGESREVVVTPLGEDRYRVTIEGAATEWNVTRVGEGFVMSASGEIHRIKVTAAGRRRFVRVGSLEFVCDLEPAGRKRSAAHARGGLEAPMPGVLTRVMVAAGESVAAGQPLVALEAMKMEHLVRAPRAGVVRAILARVGEMVSGGAELVQLEPDAPPAA